MARTHSTAKYAAIYARVSTAGAQPTTLIPALASGAPGPVPAGGTNWAMPPHGRSELGRRERR